jgi:hypothetical protein
MADIFSHCWRSRRISAAFAEVYRRAHLAAFYCHHSAFPIPISVLGYTSVSEHRLVALACVLVSHSGRQFHRAVVVVFYATQEC